MATSTLNPNNQPLATPSPVSEAHPGPQIPLGKKWPRFKAKLKGETLKQEAKCQFGYEPHEWQLQSALKVLEGNDGIVVAGTGKGKTMVFALLGLAVKLSKTKGYYIIVSPLKALEGDQVRSIFDIEGMVELALMCKPQVARMEKADIRAAALNEHTSQVDFSRALHRNTGAHLIFASPEYLLRNPRMKKLYADEEARARVLGVLVDEGHVIHEWADSFRKDYYELKTLRVILGNNVPWWALSATFTNEIFKTVYQTLSFGTARPFWGIDVGTERPNLFQSVQPMESTANSYLSLIPFIPEGAQTKDSIPKTIVFFRSVSETRDACLAFRALLPPHLHSSIQPFAAPDEESTKDQRLKDLKEGHIRVLCCTIAAGMGCDIPDIEVAVIYGVDSLVSFVQKGGRAGRNGEPGARMVWLVEDWMFESEGVGGKRMEERRAKVDPMASEYIRRQETGDCLRDFTRRVFRPNPKELGLPGFDGRNPSQLEVSWVVRGEEVHPDPGKCCSASSCQPGSDSSADDLVGIKKATTQPRHHLILKVLRSETSAAEEVLGPPPGRNGIRCPKEGKLTFRAILEKWRDDYWESVHQTAPMLSKAWVLGECSIKQLVDQARRIINTDEEKIDQRWVRALIDTVADDRAIENLVAVIKQFRSNFFESQELRPRKRRKVSGPALQQSSPSLPSQPHGSGPSSLRDKRKRVKRPRAAVQVGIQPPNPQADADYNLKQTLQESPQQLLPQISLQVTRMLPEPKLVLGPPASFPPQCGPDTIYTSGAPTQPMPILPPLSQPSPTRTPLPFSLQFPPHLSQPLLLPMSPAISPKPP